MKKIIFIVSSVVFVALAGVFVMLNFIIDGNGKKVSILDDSQKKNSREKVKTIIEGDIRFSEISKKEDKLYYLNGNNILEGDLDNYNKSNVASYPFGKAITVDWRAELGKVLVNSSEGSVIYDWEENTGEDLKAGLDLAVFNNFGDGLVYRYANKEEGQYSLNISNLYGENWEEVASLYPKDKTIKVRPGKKEAAVIAEPNSKTAAEVVLISLIDGEKTIPIKNKKGLNIKWSPDGQKLLMSYLDSQGKLKLGYYDFKNKSHKEFNAYTTVEKCVWSEDNISIYCAMMTGLSSNNSLPEAWQKEEVYSKDTFWKINSNTGEQKRILDPQENKISVDSVNLMLNKKEDKLYFIDRRSGNIFEISLEEKKSGFE